MTDISGFGLASHLGDICKNSNLSAHINLKNEILINTNLEILKKYESSGLKNNYLSSSPLIDISYKHPLAKIIYDPQTNGPLLIAIKEEDKDKFEIEYKKIVNQNHYLLVHLLKKAKTHLFQIKIYLKSKMKNY